MELIKKNIHMNRQKCRSSLQLTLDNDFNVPDVKPDIDKIIREQGEIRIQEVKTVNGRVLLKGNLMFHILYIGADSEYQMQHMEGQISFDEVVNMDDTCTGDSVQVKWELEDLSADIINSRKIGIRAILKLTVAAEEIMDEEAAVDISDAEHVEKLTSMKMVTELALNKKDTYRIKDEIKIPSGRDCIKDILYQDVILEEVEMRLVKDQLSIRGELRIFILYIGAMEERLNAYETNVSFSGMIDCNGCDENMISHVIVSLQDKDIQVKADEDGEDRILDIEIVAGLDIKVYREEQITLLSDMYGVAMDIVPVFKDAYFDNLVMKNNSKVRINDRLSIESDQAAILQICNVVGNVRIDSERIVSGGIEVEGVVDVWIMYFTEGVGSPIGSYRGAIPFVHMVEANGIDENCIYEINTAVQQINVMATSENEMEVKAVIGIDAIVFNRYAEPIITDCQIAAKDMSVLQDIPGITGYVVQKNDTLWDIAKHFSSTTDIIKEMNNLTDDDIRPGQKLMIIKQVEY